jgi:hypothetical protein
MPSRTRKQKGHRRLDGGAPKAEGVASELRERYALCTTDLETAARFPSKTLSSALFLFFATLFSTVALGAHIQQETGNRIGLSEYLLANALGGAFHAMFGAQPLLILRPTGPITAIMGKLSTLADAVELDFYQLLAATGVCVSALMFAVAYWRLSTFARRFTPFTLDIFACFVCSIYVFDGVHDVWQRLDLASMATVGRSLLDLNLALVTFAVSVKLQVRPLPTTHCPPHHPSINLPPSLSSPVSVKQQVRPPTAHPPTAYHPPSAPSLSLIYLRQAAGPPTATTHRHPSRSFCAPCYRRPPRGVASSPRFVSCSPTTPSPSPSSAPPSARTRH